MRRITWIGHATVLLEVAGARLLTDPVLRSRMLHLRRHTAPVKAPRGVDAVLISHTHHDHLDMPSLRALEGAPPVIGPPGLARTVRGAVELAPGAETTIRGARVRAVPAVHDGRRYPFTAPADTIGFVVEGIYFAGDTELFAGMADIAGVEVALLPIWGWGTSLGPGHMDPAQAASAVALMRPRIVVPIHWGTLFPIGLHRRHGHLLREPAEAFTEHVKREAPEVEVVLLRPGESLDLER